MLLLLIPFVSSAIFTRGSGKNTPSPSPTPEPVRPNMVTLFEPSEAVYDKYSAAIAATEPLRLRRDADALATLNPIDRLLYKIGRHKSLCDGKLCDRNVGVKVACNRHLYSASKVIRSLGLTVSQVCSSLSANAKQ